MYYAVQLLMQGTLTTTLQRHQPLLILHSLLPTGINIIMESNQIQTLPIQLLHHQMSLPEAYPPGSTVNNQNH